MAEPLKSYGDIHIKLVNERIHRIGFSTKTTIKSMAVWFESTYSISEDIKLDDLEKRNHNLSWTIGGDLNYGPDNRFYLNFQYTGKWIPKYDNTFYTDFVKGQPDINELLGSENYLNDFLYRSLVYKLAYENEALLNGFTLAMDFMSSSEKFKPSLAVSYYLPSMYDEKEKTRYGSLYLMPEISIFPADALTFTLGLQFMKSWQKFADSNEITNDDMDRIGMWVNDSNIYFKVNYLWSKTI
jgi:hypothetical protein